jgi:hypothetical protein
MSVTGSPRLGSPGDRLLGAPGDGVALVVVHAEEVDRGAAQGEVTVADHVGPRTALPGEPGGVGEQVGRVLATEDRVEEYPVVQGVDPPGRVDVELVGRVVRVGDGEVQGDAEVVRRPRPAELVDDQSVGEQEVVRGDQPGDPLLATGRVLAAGVAEEGRAPGLVERRPDRDPVSDGVVHGGGVLGEPVGRVPVGPPAGVLERLRQVPVVERQPRRDAGVVELVDEPAVEVEPALVDRATVRADPRPGDREAVRREAEVAHQRDVLRHPVVVVARDGAGVAVDDRARHAGERVPDGGGPAVLVDGTLDLVGGGGRAPEEAGREREPGVAVG